MIDPTLNPDDPAWLNCSIDEFREALLDERLPYEHSSHLISILLARFPCLRDPDDPFGDFTVCPYGIDEFSMRLYKSLLKKRMDPVFEELEQLFTQIWPCEGLHAATERLMHDLLLRWLLTYSDNSGVFVDEPFSMVSVEVDLSWVDLVPEVSNVFDESICDRDSDGDIIPLSPREYLERKKRRATADPFGWACVGPVEPAVTVVSPDVISFQDETALRNFGYRVGKSSPLTESERRDLLMDFYSSDFETRAKRDPLYRDIGEHKSGERLGYMTAVIASNIRRFFYNDSEKYEHAIRHWIEDLRFLRLKFESSTGWWPDVAVNIYEFYGYKFYLAEEIPF